jgi:hypothetical protein
MTTRFAVRTAVSCLAAVLMLSSLGAIPGHAQVTGATLSGTITDPSGARIPGAQISVTNAATAITQEFRADSAGYYAAPNLAPGAYEIRVTAAGFSTTTSTVTLAVGAQQEINIQIKVGAASQTVEVAGESQQIDLASSALTGQVESGTILELPLNGRDWTALATLSPGVNLVETQVDYAQSARGNRGFGSQLTINGQRSANNNYRLDGISVNDYANSGPGNVIGAALGVDAIQEFSVLTGGFPAEYGKATGGVINAITKSGTNAFHGDVYEFFRDSAMDSRDYFSRTANLPLAQFRRNQFGAAAGGPIIKSKTFIFGDYEGFQQIKGITSSVSVLSDAARAGNLVSGQVTVDPAAAAELAMFPHATPGTSSGDTGKFINIALQTVPQNYFTVRVDHTITQKDTLFGTYLFDDTDFTQPDSFNNVMLKSHSRRQTVVIGESHTFGPSVVNALRIGYSRTHALNLIPFGAINAAAGQKSLGSTSGQNAPLVAISGLTRNQGGVGSASNYEHSFNNYQFADDAFWIHGTHTLKFGTDVERIQYNYIASVEPGGRWNFSNISSFLTNNAKYFETGLPATITPREMRQTLAAGYAQDDWRIRPNLTLNLGIRYEMTTLIHDAQGKITNLANITDAAPQCGVQYTAPFAPGGISPPGSVCGSVGQYYQNPTLKNFEPRVGFTWDPFQNGKTSVRGAFGIYDILPLPGYFLVLQSQAAPFMIFDSVTKPSSGPNPLQGQFPSGGQNLITNPTGGLQVGKLSTSTVQAHPKRNYVMEWNLNVQRQLTQDMSVSLGFVGSHGVHMVIRGDDGNMALPTLTSEGYLFPCGPPIHADGTCTAGNNAAGKSAQINPAVGPIRYLYWGADSFYDGMNVGLDKRLTHGLRFQVSYTWSKSIDDDSSTVAGDTFGNSLNSLYWFAPRSLRGRSDFNVSQSASINLLAVVPTPRSLNAFAKTALGGWQMGGIYKINSGVPTTPIISGDSMGVGNAGADQFGIPTRVRGCDPVNHNFIGSATPVYINVNCYTLPTVASSSPYASQCATFTGAVAPAPAGQVYCANLLGNAGRNTLIGPKLENLDFSATKNFPVHRISELAKLQFRAEIFNILNHSNFVAPGPLTGGSLFDQTGARLSGGFLDTLATQPRDVQLALKVIW